MRRLLYHTTTSVSVHSPARLRCCTARPFARAWIIITAMYNNTALALNQNPPEAMNRPRSALFFLLLVTWCFGVLAAPPDLHLASPRKTGCKVRLDQADCSHLSLKEIPADLPRNITGLDMSHNRMAALSPASLAPYPGLRHLNLSYNSLTKLPAGVCQALGALRLLDVQNNEVHLLTEDDLSHCGNLTHLNLGSNRLKIRADPFASLQSLTLLNVSNNNLQSAKLGSRPMLPRLVTLILSNSAWLTALKKDDFSFLNQSSSFRVLDLSSISLRSIEPGCFKPIATMEELTMDGINLPIKLTSKLWEELSGSAIRKLSLKNTRLVTITNMTFKGLEKTNLTSLDLAYNNMAKIGEGSFKWLTELQHLSLEHNNLKNLTKEILQGLGNLKLLNLRRALVKGKASTTPIIYNFAFQPLGALESLIMENTAFREIKEHTFSGLTSLRYLHLGFASCTSLKIISNLTLVSLASSPLQTLNLTATAISYLGPGAFSSLGNLTTLLLAYNFISQTLTGAEFQGLDQLQELILSKNQQRIKLSTTSFVSVPRLRALMLNKAININSTLDMNPSPFKLLSNLTHLDLSNNNIANINAGLLEGLEHLEVLKVPHNNLAQIWKNANPGGPVLFLKGLRSLTALDVESNGLDEIPREGLRGLTKLKELNLSGNILNHLEDSVFDDLTSLRVFRLKKNLITSVRKEVFGPALADLSELVMDKNPFDCTCESILWFVTWLNRTNASVPGLGEYRCNTPPLYFNRTVLQFDPLSCRDMSAFFALYVLSSTTVLTLLATAFLFRFHGWRIQFYWNILVNRTLGLSDANSVEGKGYEYDAYVIHAAEDLCWVRRSLLPLEDKHYTFFLEDRDSVPGSSRLESIVENMRNSRKIIFVVTESLLQDPWCRKFKAHHALHQVIEDSRDAVVLIFLQDVQDYRLSRSLLLRKGMLRSRCLLHWPAEREKIPAFHQKLRIALGSTNTVLRQ